VGGPPDGSGSSMRGTGMADMVVRYTYNHVSAPKDEQLTVCPSDCGIIMWQRWMDLSSQQMTHEGKENIPFLKPSVKCLACVAEGSESVIPMVGPLANPDGRDCSGSEKKGYCRHAMPTIPFFSVKIQHLPGLNKYSSFALPLQSPCFSIACHFVPSRP
jgi:hypothetical protein